MIDPIHRFDLRRVGSASERWNQQSALVSYHSVNRYSRAASPIPSFGRIRSPWSMSV